MTYPNGTSGSLDDAIGRLASLVQDGTTLESYQYLGLSTVVGQADADGIILTDLQQPTDVYANTDGGDQYTGLDRFGRTIDQNYVTIATGATVERYQYTYDADGNVTSKDNLLDSSLDETYTYDDLNRLTSDTRGGTAYQTWDLDSLGNMDSITTSGTSETNTFNSQNEMTEEGASTLAYDANGNNTTDDQGNTLIYDAWNRLVMVKDSTGATVTTYSYDGTGRRITEAPTGGTTSDLYYSDQWQVIEERQGGTAASNVTYTYVWSATYVDALLSRTSYISGTATQTLYALHDANYNVTALVGYNADTEAWEVQERYLYDAYGSVTILNPDFTTKSDQATLDGWNYLFQGKRRDFTDGLDDSRHRVYSPTMQRWIQEDPARYTDGQNLLQFVESDPIENVDPSGLMAQGSPCCAKAFQDLQVDAKYLRDANELLKFAQAQYKSADTALVLSTIDLTTASADVTAAHAVTARALAIWTNASTLANWAAATGHQSDAIDSALESAATGLEAAEDAETTAVDRQAEADTANTQARHDYDFTKKLREVAQKTDDTASDNWAHSLEDYIKCLLQNFTD